MNIITELLASIKEKKTINELLRYIDAPVNNKTEDISRLVRYYSNFYPDFEDETQLKPEVVAKKLFRGIPKQEDKLIRLRTISKRTTPLIKNFLIAKQLKKDEFTRRRLLRKAYKEQSLPNLSGNELREIRKKLAAKHLDSEQDYLLRYQFEKEYYFENNRSLDEKVEAYDGLMLNLNYHYFLAKLKIVIDRNSLVSSKDQYEKTYLEKSIVTLIETHLQHIEDTKTTPVNVIILQIYFNLYKTLIDENRNNHETLYNYYLENKTLLATYEEQIDINEKEEIFRYLRDNLLLLTKRGAIDYHEQLFELYELGLKLGVVIIDGALSDLDYISIIDSVLSLNKLGWLLNEFIDKYLVLLNAEVQDETMVLTKAFVSFENKEYSETYQKLQKTNFTTRLFDLRSKTLIIKSVYKLQNAKLFDNLRDDFQFYLVRNSNKFGEAIIEQNNHFIRIISELERIRRVTEVVDGFKVEAEKMTLMEELNQKSSIASKTWLIQEIQELHKLQ